MAHAFLPSRDLRYSFTLSDACFSSDLLMQAEHKGVAQLRKFGATQKKGRKALLRNWGLLML